MLTSAISAGTHSTRGLMFIRIVISDGAVDRVSGNMWGVGSIVARRELWWHVKMSRQYGGLVADIGSE